MNNNFDLPNPLDLFDDQEDNQEVDQEIMDLADQNNQMLLEAFKGLEVARENVSKDCDKMLKALAVLDEEEELTYEEIMSEGFLQDGSQIKYSSDSLKETSFFDF